MSKKYLVNAIYNKDTDNPVYWFLEDGKITKLVIPKSDSDSCFKQKDLTDQEIREIIHENGCRGSIKGFDHIKQYDVLKKTEVDVTRVRMKSANAVGKCAPESAHENHIKREYRHSFDKKWYFGMPYTDEYELEDIYIEDKYHEMFDEYEDHLRNTMLKWVFADFPEVPRLALDIEVLNRDDVQPNPKKASEPIISCAFDYYDDKKGEVLVLSPETRGYDVPMSENKMLKEWLRKDRLKVTMFNSERELVEAILDRITDSNYPLVTTFYGTEFDLPYIYNRAINLGMRRQQIPLTCYQFTINKNEYWKAYIRDKLHLDLHSFLDLPVVKNYVFKAKYLNTSLNSVCSNLLGKEKFEHEESIGNMPIADLVWYNYKDTALTLELTKFDDDLVMKIIFLFMRIGRQRFSDAAHRAISGKITNLLKGYMIEKNILIPSREELRKFGEIESQSVTGKMFEGAIVFDPSAGVHISADTCDFGCFPPNTEILTNEGWLNLKKIKKKTNSKVATVNLNNNNIEYQEIEKIHEYHYNGEMFHYKVRGGMDLMVTPNHRMVYRKRNRKGGRKKVNSSLTWSNKWFIEKAQNLDRYWYSIPHFGNWKGKKNNINVGSYEFKPDEFLPLFGWLLTDGTINKRYIQVSQVKEKNLESIRKAFENSGFKFKHNKHGTEHKFTIHNAPFCRALIKWLDGKRLTKEKHIPRKILELDKKSLKLLFDTMIRGDGTHQFRMGKKQVRNFSSTSYQLASDFQELALKLGYACSIFSEERTTNFGNEKEYDMTCYIVSMSYIRKNVFNGQRPVKKVPYNGKVWCVTVPNGTIIVRRNGKVVVTGNSLYPTQMCNHNVSFETMNCGHPECKNATDNQVPGLSHYVCKKHKGIMPQTIGLIKDIRLNIFKPMRDNNPTASAIEQALKVFINASYGVTGHLNFGLYCPPAAESTTAYGRYATKKLADKTRSYEGVELIFGDTDSAGLTGCTEEIIQEMIEWSDRELNIELAHEYHAPLFVIHKKKNYFYIDEDGNYHVKGLTGKKRNTPDIVSQCFFETLEQIAKFVGSTPDFEKYGKENPEIVKQILKSIVTDTIRKYYKKIWRKEGDVEDYAITTKMTKPISEYKHKVRHVKAAKRYIDWMRENTGNKYIHHADDDLIQAGTYISYILHSKDDHFVDIEHVEDPNMEVNPIPVQIATTEDIKPELYHKLLLSVMKQLMDPIGVEVENVVEGIVGIESPQKVLA